MTTEPLTKAARLAIGGAVAPVVRRQAAAPRRVTLVDKDGNVTGQTTSVEVAKSLLARAEIEFGVQDGKRPEWVNCKTCGALVKVSKGGPLPEVCRRGAHKCVCGKKITGGGGCGFGKMCVRCTGTRALKALTREKRSQSNSERNRKRWSMMTPEQRGDAMRRMVAAVSPEVRRQNASRAGKASMAKRARKPPVRPRRCACGAKLRKGAEQCRACRKAKGNTQ